MIRIYRHNGCYGYKAILEVPFYPPIIKRGQGYRSEDEAFYKGKEELVAEAFRVASRHWKQSRTYLEQASRYNERGKIVSCIAQAKQEIEVAVQILCSLLSFQNGCRLDKQSIYRVSTSLECILSLAHYCSLKHIRTLLSEFLGQIPDSIPFSPDDFLSFCSDGPETA